MAAALAKVRDSESHAGVRLALEFMVLTATRSNEVRGAACDEVECSETGVAREVAEAALAHKVRSQAEAAYARSDLLDRRREVMQAWAAYLAGKRRDPEAEPIR